jgi:hypothetical protein
MYKFGAIDIIFIDSIWRKNHHQQQQEDLELAKDSRTRQGGEGANENKTHANFMKSRIQALWHVLELPLETC